MEMVSVSCNCCGAPLKVGAQVRFVTCQFCNTQLEIKHTDSSILAEQITRLADNTTQIAQDLEVIKLQNEIERLDLEAAATLDQSLRAHGHRGRAGGILGLAFTIFFALVCFAMAGTFRSSGASGLFAIVPIGIGVLVLVTGFAGFFKSASRLDRQDEHRRRRTGLVRKVAELSRRSKSQPWLRGGRLHE